MHWDVIPRPWEGLGYVLHQSLVVLRFCIFRSNRYLQYATEEFIAKTCCRLEKGPVTENDLREIHRDLVNCCNCTERELEKQQRIRTEQLNEICQVNCPAKISELTDHVEKARLRENELAERVARWVEYLKEEKQKMLARGSRLCATGALSAIISDDIEYNISMLMQMRARMHKKLGEWDARCDEYCEMNMRMEITRQQLLERIKEQQQRETTAKAGIHFFEPVEKVHKN
ncbi:hypothetical protein COOONC_23717 [Cooperia oncophora]